MFNAKCLDKSFLSSCLLKICYYFSHSTDEKLSLKSLLVIYWCITNHHKLISLKQPTFIISQLLWEDWVWLSWGLSLDVFHRLNRELARARCWPEVTLGLCHVGLSVMAACFIKVYKRRWVCWQDENYNLSLIMAVKAHHLFHILLVRKNSFPVI